MKVALYATVATAALSFEPRAIAQKADQPAATGTDQLQEIVVTARRREERLQTVPITVEAFTPKALEERHIENTTDLSHFSPGLTQQSDQGRDEQYLAIRGQVSAPGGPAVVGYFDEVPDLSEPQPSGSGAGGGVTGPGRYFDLEDVQVLEGPQGTLFGRNTTGGAVLLTSKKPSDDYHGFASVEFGNYGDVDVQAATNLSIVPDKLFIRVSGEHAKRDGFTHSLSDNKDLDNRDYWVARTSIMFRPTDDLTNLTVADFTYSHDNGTSIILKGYNPCVAFGSINIGTKIPGIAPNGLVGLTLGACTSPVGVATYTNGREQVSFADSLYELYQKFHLGGQSTLLGFIGLNNNLLNTGIAQQQQLGDRTIAGEFPGAKPSSGPLDKQWHSTLVNTTTYDLTDDLAVKNIFGWQIFKDQIALSFSPDFPENTPIAGPGGWQWDLEEYTDELQAQGTARNGKLHYQAGLYYFFTHPYGTTTYNSYFLGPQPQATYLPDERSRAVYAQATYDLSDVTDLLDGFSLTAGYRFSFDDKTETASAAGTGAVLDKKTGTTIGSYFTQRTHNENASWNLQLQYQVTDASMVYISGRRGYIAGGINLQDTLPSPSNPLTKYAPQVLDDVEIGTKTDWSIGDVKLRTNVDVFQSYFKNLQQNSMPQAYVNGTPITVSVTQNAGHATFTGAELQATILPGYGFEITGNYAYLYYKFNEFNPIYVVPGTPLDPGIAAAPKHKMQLAITYHFPFVPSEIGDMAFTLSGNYTSTENTDTGTYHEFGENINGTGLVNMNYEWNGIYGSQFDVSAFMTNVLDRNYLVGILPTEKTIGVLGAIYGEPRMFGFKVKYHW
jgi:iron complex outermembrane receptor protein